MMGAPERARLTESEMRGAASHSNRGEPFTGKPGAWEMLNESAANKAWDMCRAEAIEAAEAVGCTVVKVAAILDRKEGGSEELTRRGYDFVALLRANPEGRIEIAGAL